MNSDALTLTPEREARNIKKDYLAGDSRLAPFYAYTPQQPDFTQIIADKNFPDSHRKVLVEVLTSHYEGLEIDEAARKNLELLAKPNSFTLTAGHQLNLFGGPLYTQYKVLTVAKLAQELNVKHPDFNFIPVFWIHTEDHDFEEINHYYPSFKQKVTYPSPFEGATGDHVLTSEIEKILPAHFPDELNSFFKAGKTLGEATLGFSMALYAKYGVLVLDASDKRLKALFKDVLHQELFDPISPKAVRETSSDLYDAGYPLQIHARDINLFYTGEGGRDRIIFENDTFRTIGGATVWSKTEMEREVESSPENFSPNVCLRPLYQEFILPNLTYTGGWGELSYWMQLKGMFDAYKINFPLLLPRNSATLFKSEIWESWAALNLDPADIQQPLHDIFRKYIPQIWDAVEYEALAEDMLATFGKMEKYIMHFSETLPRSVKGQEVKTQKFIKNTYKKIHRVIRHNDPKPFNQIEKLKNQIQPEGLVQERTLGLGSFPNFQPERLIETIWGNIKPMDFSHHFMVLDKPS